MQRVGVALPLHPDRLADFRTYGQNNWHWSHGALFVAKHHHRINARCAQGGQGDRDSRHQQ